MPDIPNLTPAEQAAYDALVARFDQRLASLREPGAGERLRSVLTEPAQLDGQVIAGDVGDALRAITRNPPDLSNGLPIGPSC